MKKAVLGALAMLTMGAVAPAAVAAPSLPTPVEAPRSNPVEKTDGRRTLGYYVPKGTRQREKSRVTKAMAMLGAPAPCNRNRFARRSVTKAALAGRGRAGELAGEKIYLVKIPMRDGRVVQHQTTRRTTEKLTRLQAFREMLRGKALAARVIAAAAVVEGES